MTFADYAAFHQLFPLAFSVKSQEFDDVFPVSESLLYDSEEIIYRTPMTIVDVRNEEYEVPIGTTPRMSVFYG